LDQTRLAPAGSCCWNPDCPAYTQVGHHTLRKFGRDLREKCNASRVKSVRGRMPKRMEPSFTGAIMHHKPSWTAWPGFRTALAGARFIAICGVKEETVCVVPTSCWAHRRDRGGDVSQLSGHSCPTGRTTRTYVGHKGEKGSTAKRRPEALFGAARLLR
jgi:hypothetical protein